MASGFGSLSAFNKCFRKVSGMSPSDFKRDASARPVCPWANRMTWTALTRLS